MTFHDPCDESIWVNWFPMCLINPLYDKNNEHHTLSLNVRILALAVTRQPVSLLD